VKGLQGTMLLFVPLFVPFTLLTYPRELLYNGVLQAVALGLLFLCALEYPFEIVEQGGAR